MKLALVNSRSAIEQMALTRDWGFAEDVVPHEHVRRINIAGNCWKMNPARAAPRRAAWG